MRAVLFDTETTGLDPLTGDRVIEVAALELMNDLPTGESFHRLVHPERDIPPDATRVHGITIDKLASAPKFSAIADDLLAFFQDSPLVAHNAPFDFGFLNAEFARLKRPSLTKARMIDTLAIAKLRFPGLPNSLDALCRRFSIDLTARTTHNALLDCRLLEPRQHLGRTFPRTSLAIVLSGDDYLRHAELERRPLLHAALAE